ncbi:MAG: RNA repair domain-containing protein [Pseudomonadota bacterium]
MPLSEIFFEPDDHFAFDLYNHEGELHSIPLHRVKQVFRNGELIWHREHQARYPSLPSTAC